MNKNKIEPWLQSVKKKQQSKTDSLKSEHLVALDEVWKKIDHSIAEREQSKNKKGMIFLFAAEKRKILLQYAAGIVILLGVGLYFFNNNDKKKISTDTTSYQTASHSIEEGSVHNRTIISEKKEFSIIKNKQTVPSSTIQNRVKKTNIVAKVRQSDYIEKINTDVEQSGEEKNDKEESTSKDLKSKQNTNKKKDFKFFHKKGTRDFLAKTSNFLERDIKKENFLDRIQITTSTTTAAGLTSSSSNFPPTVLMSNNIININKQNFIESQPLIKYENADIKHAIPISMGVNVSFPLNKVLILHSGLRYSFLKSNVSNLYKNGDLYIQNVHCIGIPLGISANIFRYNNLNLYLGMGLGIDKVVSASVKNMKLPLPWQISCSGYTGLSYQVGPKVSIYLEPGISYYFDNKSPLRYYYTDKPLNLSISMGVRLQIENPLIKK